jgi:putative acetyltransferase
MEAPTSHVTVRSMLPLDLPATVDLWVNAWQAAYPSIDFEARRAWAIDRIACLEREGASSILALRGDRIVGAVIINPKTGYLDQFVVATDCWGRGIAQALLLEATRLCPKGIDIHVNQDNTRAIRFYEKSGFVISGADVNPRSGAPLHKMSWRPSGVAAETAR